MSGYYKIVRLFCYDCNKRSKIKDNKPICVRCDSKNCAVTKVWTEIKSATNYNFPRFERSDFDKQGNVVEYKSITDFEVNPQCPTISITYSNGFELIRPETIVEVKKDVL